MNPKVEPYIRNRIIEHSTKEIDPITLLSNNRFDIAIKLLYLSLLNKNNKIAQDLYIRHIQIFSLGKIQEPGNPDKNSIQKFINVFKKIDQSISGNGFNSNISLIPLSNNGTAINGSHRIASAIYRQKKISTIMTTMESHCYDFKYFESHFFPKKYLNEAALIMTKLRHESRLSLLWGNIYNDFSEITDLFPDVYYYQDYKLTANGIVALTSIVYWNEVWLGKPSEISSGAQEKARRCFEKSNYVRLILFNKKGNTQKLKESIRSKYNFGKHALHISDDHKDTFRLANTFLNQNTVECINKNQLVLLKESLETNKKIYQYSDEKNIELSSFIVNGSQTLELYGLRKAKDIDLISKDTLPKDINKFISSHNDQAFWHKTSKSNLIYDPSNYISIQGVKYITLDRLAEFKSSRREKKDINDLKLIYKINYGKGKLIKNQYIIDIYKTGLFSLLRLRNKILILSVIILRDTPLFVPTRKLYKLIVSKISSIINKLL